MKGYKMRVKRFFSHTMDILRRADVELDKPRFYLRFSHDLDYISLSQQRYAGQMIADIGRMLGNWQKKL
jgi:hypothetical protein